MSKLPVLTFYYFRCSPGSRNCHYRQ